MGGKLFLQDQQTLDDGRDMRLQLAEELHLHIRKVAPLLRSNRGQLSEKAALVVPEKESRSVAPTVRLQIFLIELPPLGSLALIVIAHARHRRLGFLQDRFV